ncbi:hypothetical protein AAHB49_06990, partial [Bacillus cereus]
SYFVQLPVWVFSLPSIPFVDASVFSHLSWKRFRVFVRRQLPLFSLWIESVISSIFLFVY